MLTVRYRHSHSGWTKAQRVAWRQSITVDARHMLSASSSAEWAVLVTGPGLLGIDIEHQSRWHFASEALHIADTHDAAWRWVRIEALLKATGRGLADGVPAVLIPLVASVGTVPYAGRTWQLIDVMIAPELAVAVAVETGTAETPIGDVQIVHDTT